MSRNQVLELLSQGDYISGEAISEQLGLSRAAIWKAVDGLRKAGYEIEAKTGLGYRLLQRPDLLSEAEIRAHLPAQQVVGQTLKTLDTVDSTNTYLKQWAVQGAPEGTVVVSDCQSAGRGRMSRAFHSPPGTGIYMSVLLRPNCSPQTFMGFTAMAAVAVCQAIEDVCGLQTYIKWPNDVVIDRKKLCGILTEMSIEWETGRIDHVVLGMGINVGQAAFPEELAHCAVSLKQMGYTVSRPQLTAAILQQIEQMRANIHQPQMYLEAYRQRCVNLGKSLNVVRLDGSTQPVEGHAIDQAFALVVRHEDGHLETLQSGEVSVSGFYGLGE